MKRSILKPVAFGILFGAAAFFAPFFLIKGFFFFLFIGFVFRMIWWRGYRWGHHFRYQMVMADKIRSMSDEEYNELKNKLNDCDNHYSGRGCHGRGWNRGCYSDRYDTCEPKKDASTDTKTDTEKK
jgi:hypothetical protein